MEKYFYLGSANTCQGFKNCFQFINPAKNGMTYILKGGPGTGKSTFMRKISKYFEEKGYNIEYFYCSSDSDSLDGVRIIEKNISIVDGTAPHVTEASMPGIKEKIINLGNYINSKIKKHKSQIENLLEKKSHYFSVAYAYLRCVGDLLKVEKIERIKSNTRYNFSQLLTTLKLTKNEKVGEKRQLFLSFISQTGISSLLDKNKFKNIINLGCKDYFDGFQVLSELSNTLSQQNISHTCFLSIFNPEEIEAIYIPNISILIVNNKEEMFKNEKLINTLIKKAGENIYKAKFYHKKIEKFYIANMDFNGIDKEREKLIKEIELS